MLPVSDVTDAAVSLNILVSIISRLSSENPGVNVPALAILVLCALSSIGSPIAKCEVAKTHERR